ncbi:MAG: polysaccharide deacetylase family protein [Calditrichia bacterium]
MKRKQLTGKVKNLLLASGFYHLLRKVKPNKQAAILRYHAVVEESENDYTARGIALSPVCFERHVAFFKKYYNILPFSEIIGRLEKEEPLPPNAVTFTFDDGYADNYRAAEILHRHGGYGMFYIVTEAIDRTSRLWLAEVTVLIRRTQKNTLTLTTAEGETILPLGSDEERTRAIRWVVKRIKSNDLSYRENLRQQLVGQLGEEPLLKRVSDLMLTWEQVNTMLGWGMEIGSHTLTHLNLPNAQPMEAEREISQSRRFLEAKLKRPADHFSYPNSGPYDYYNEKVRSLVVKAGYRSATTSYQGFAGKDSDLFALRRIRTVPALSEVVHSLEWERWF